MNFQYQATSEIHKQSQNFVAVVHVVGSRWEDFSAMRPEGIGQGP